MAAYSCLQIEMVSLLILMVVSIVKAFQFVANLSRKTAHPAAKSTCKLMTHLGAFVTDIYLPQGKWNQKTVLLVHGMCPLGKDDPRVVRYSANFSALGYKVVVPQYQNICEFRFLPDMAEEIVATIQAVRSNLELCPSAMVSLMSASFSGGLCLIAAAKPEVAYSLSALLIVGSYGNIDTIFYRVVNDKITDDYARLIIFKNLIRFSSGVNVVLEQIFNQAILDLIPEGLKPSGRAKQCDENSAENKQFLRVQRDQQYRKELMNEIQRSPEAALLIKGLSVVGQIRRIKAHVLLLHGDQDPVIPAAESKQIYYSLIRSHCSVRLLVTPILTHSDARLSLQFGVAILKLIYEMAYFFRHA